MSGTIIVRTEDVSVLWSSYMRKSLGRMQMAGRELCGGNLVCKVQINKSALKRRTCFECIDVNRKDRRRQL